MSRIGNKPIAIPGGIEVKLESDNTLRAKGPKGELAQAIHPEMKVEMAEGEIRIKRPTDQKRHRAMHGLYRALVQNMVTGVSQGYKQELELVGVGFRASVQGKVLDLVLGYSHHVMVELPSEIHVTAGQEKGQNPMVTLESADKQLLGEVAAKIKGLKAPEPYKGKGIRFKNEWIRRKAGKSAAK